MSSQSQTVLDSDDLELVSKIIVKSGVHYFDMTLTDQVAFLNRVKQNGGVLVYCGEIKPRRSARIAGKTLVFDDSSTKGI